MTAEKTAEHGEQKSCPRCSAPFDCGLAAGHDKCWCADLPHVMPVTGTRGDCLCRECLSREIALRTVAK